MVERIKKNKYIYICMAVSILPFFLTSSPVKSNFTLTGSQKSSLLDSSAVAEDDKAGHHMASGHAHGRSMNWPTSGHDHGEYLQLSHILDSILGSVIGFIWETGGTGTSSYAWVPFFLSSSKISDWTLGFGALCGTLAFCLSLWTLRSTSV